MHLDEQRVTQAVLAVGRQRREAHAIPVTGSRSGRRATSTRACCGSRTPDAACPAADRERIFERFGRGGRREWRRGFRARPVDRARDRRGARRHGRRSRDAVPHGARFELAPAEPRTGATDGPHPDPRGRGAHRVLRGQGAARRGPPAHGRGATGGRASTRRCPASSTSWCSTSACPGSTGSRCSTPLRSQGSRMPGDRADGSRLGDRHRVSALEGGADDYMPKPFRFAELLARVRLRLRQADVHGRRPARARTCSTPAGSVSTSAHGRRRRTAGDVDLSAREFALAEVFMLNPGQVLSPRAAARPRVGLRLRPGLQRGGRVRRVPAQASSAPAPSAPCAGMGYRFNALTPKPVSRARGSRSSSG